MRSYPDKGAWKLDEIDGVLHYKGEPIAAVADLLRARAVNRAYSKVRDEARARREALWQARLMAHSDQPYEQAEREGWDSARWSQWDQAQLDQAEQERREDAQEQERVERAEAEIDAMTDAELLIGEPEVGVHYGSPTDFARACALIERDGVANPHLCGIFVCPGCGSWAIGSGRVACLPECRKAYRAGLARARRARTRTVVTETCTVCGGPLPMQRTTRRYCSNRCRQVDYRKRVAASPGREPH